MSDKQTGGPAFPTEVWDSEGVPQHTEGMTLRDYFAAKAMQAFVSAWVATKQYPNTDMEVAQHAYQMADAMLKARDE